MANILHRIKVWLYENVLTPDNHNDLIGRVAAERTLNTEQVCESAVARGGADTSVAAMMHNVNLFHKEMAYLMSDAFRINTGYYQAGIGLHGTFESPAEHFTADKHSLYFFFQQGELLRKELAGIEVEVMGMAVGGINIQQVTDVKTGSVNDRLTPGRNLRISGTKIKLAGDNDTVGVWFVSGDNNNRIRVDMTDVAINNPSELMIIIPELAQGAYKLEITTQFTVGAIRKEPRTATFDRILTVY